MMWIVLGVVVLLLLWLMLVYNRMVSLRQTTGQAWSDVDVQLKLRHDLVPNLVETVRGYAAHERGTLEAVMAARGSALTAQGPAAQAQAEGQLGAALGRLMAVVEAYPDLKANQNFLQLQAQLADIDGKIAAARRFFNNAVAEYNSIIQSVPAVFIAGSLGVTARTFFEVTEAERAVINPAPQVKF